MNACEPLVSTVDKIAIAAKITIATRAAEKANAHALTDRPTLNAGTAGIYASDGFMAGYSRPVDWKLTLHGTGIGMAYAASLDAYPYLAWPRIANGLPHKLKPSGGHGLHRLIGRRAFHHSVPSTHASVIKAACAYTA